MTFHQSMKSIENYFLNKTYLDDLDGVLFPIGMMFDKDNLSLNANDIKKLINANFISIVHTIQKYKKIHWKKKIMHNRLWFCIRFVRKRN